MNKKQAIIGAILLVCFFASGFVARHVRTPRILARVVAPNGIEFVVLQKWCYSGEPFDPFRTSCYYRKHNGPWGWLYYDNEDFYWAKSNTVLDPIDKEIKVHRDGMLTIVFDWETEEYTVSRKNRQHPDHARGAERWMPLGWDLSDDR